MKHILPTVTTEAFSLLDEVVEIKNNKYCKDDDNQFKIQIAPVISNIFFKRELKVIENIKFETIVKLARVLNDQDMSLVINALKY